MHEDRDGLKIRLFPKDPNWVFFKQLGRDADHNDLVIDEELLVMSRCDAVHGDYVFRMFRVDSLSTGQAQPPAGSFDLP